MTEPLTIPQAQTGAVQVDPYAALRPASPVRFLYGINPLAKLLAPVPAMVLLVFVRDLATPLAFVALTAIVLLIGVRFTRRLVALLVLVPVAALVMGVGFAIWTDASGVDQSVVLWQIGGYDLALLSVLSCGLVGLISFRTSVSLSRRDRARQKSEALQD